MVEGLHLSGDDPHEGTTEGASQLNVLDEDRLLFGEIGSRLRIECGRTAQAEEIELVLFEQSLHLIWMRRNLGDE